MEFDLVDHRLDGTGFLECENLFRQEVGNADGTQLTCLVRILKAAPRCRVDFLPVRMGLFDARPVDEVQVNVIGAERLEGSIDGSEGLCVAAIHDPVLGRQENVFSCNAGCAHTLSDAVFVSVACRRIDMAVACIECRENAVTCDLTGRGLPGAVAETRNLDTVGHGKAIG